MIALRNAARGLLLIGAAAGVLALAGCSCKKEAKPAPVVVKRAPQPPPAQPAPPAKRPAPDHRPGESLIHAPSDYIGTVVIQAPRYAQKTADMAFTQNEINQFQALKGRYPYSLKELEDFRGEPLPVAPAGMTYKYDSNTGKLEVVLAD